VRPSISLLLPSLVVLAALLGACGGDDDASSGSSGAGGLPDGAYPCAFNSAGQLVTMGELVIDGPEYGGFSGGLRGGYSLAEDSLAFSAGFSGLPDGYDVLSAAWLTSTSSDERFVSIKVISEASNNVLTITCSPG